MNKKAYNIDLKVGDVVLGGKFKNQRMVVEKFGTNDIGQPTVNDKSLLAVRIEKTLPNSKKSSETLAQELNNITGNESEVNKTAFMKFPNFKKSFQTLYSLGPEGFSRKAIEYGKTLGDTLNQKIVKKMKPEANENLIEALKKLKNPELIKMYKENKIVPDQLRKYLNQESIKSSVKTFKESIPAMAVSLPVSIGSIYGGKKLLEEYRKQNPKLEKISFDAKLSKHIKNVIKSIGKNTALDTESTLDLNNYYNKNKKQKFKITKTSSLNLNNIYHNALYDELTKISNIRDIGYHNPIGDIGRSIFGYHNLNEISKKTNIPKKDVESYYHFLRAPKKSLYSNENIEKDIKDIWQKKEKYDKTRNESGLFNTQAGSSEENKVLKMYGKQMDNDLINYQRTKRNLTKKYLDIKSKK
jgi:hypothetical protein